jgi:peptidoglycan/xylan/chitin deacetylase (PgdA/CDA1 family)
MFCSLPVLMYHSISHNVSDTAVSPEIFAGQCAALSRAGWRSLSLAEAEDYFLRKSRLPRKSCLISFDDGYLDNYLIAAPILRQYGLQAVIFPVLELLEKKAVVRSDNDAPLLAEQKLTYHKGQLVREEHFCSLAEIGELMRQGLMTPAPHSLRHERVAASPAFRGLMTPGKERGYFSMPSYGAVWGMPKFPLGYSLTTRAFLPAPELLALVSKTVPQQWEKAKEYLAVGRNRGALLRRIAGLESLGRMESMEEYRWRLYREFFECREFFRRHFKISPRSFCWPWGGYNAIALEEAGRAGFRLFFTTGIGANTPSRVSDIRRFKVFDIPGRRLVREVRAMSITGLAQLSAMLLRAKKWLPS